jgi:cytochrome c peroxidase
MRKKIVITVLLVIGLSALIYVLYRGDLISQFSSQSKENAQNKEVPGAPDTMLLIQAHALFGKLPATMPGSEKDTPEMIALGENLYFEKAISINKTQSCNSCHPIDNKGPGADNLKTGKGALGKSGDRNDPSTLNAGFQIAQFWDGRAATLEEQAQGPPLNPIEMGMPNGEAVAERLKEIKHYPAEFKKAFPDEKDPVTFDNFAKAVAAFERTLISRGRFDRFIDGDEQALTAQEMEGMRTFINVGCIQCHIGPNLGGMTFQKIGVFHEYTKDFGRFDVTKLESDKYFFKVPMLRNVTLTAPYFHDGEVDNLAKAIELMGYLQLNKQLKDEEINNILRFMTTLDDAERTTATALKVKNLVSPV